LRIDANFPTRTYMGAGPNEARRTFRFDKLGGGISEGL